MRGRKRAVRRWFGRREGVERVGSKSCPALAREEELGRRKGVGGWRTTWALQRGASWRAEVEARPSSLGAVGRLRLTSIGSSGRSERWSGMALLCLSRLWRTFLSLASGVTARERREPKAQLDLGREHVRRAALAVVLPHDSRFQSSHSDSCQLTTKDSSNLQAATSALLPRLVIPANKQQTMPVYSGKHSTYRSATPALTALYKGNFEPSARPSWRRLQRP